MLRNRASRLFPPLFIPIRGMAGYWREWGGWRRHRAQMLVQLQSRGDIRVNGRCETCADCVRGTRWSPGSDTRMSRKSKLAAKLKLSKIGGMHLGTIHSTFDHLEEGSDAQLMILPTFTQMSPPSYHESSKCRWNIFWWVSSTQSFWEHAWCQSERIWFTVRTLLLS